MNLKYKYWFFEKALPKVFCNEVIQHALKKKETFKGSTFGISTNKKLTRKQSKDLKKYRDSNVVWLNDQWIYDTVIPYIHTANRNAGWNFQIERAEDIQFTIYKKGQYYNYHQDSTEEPYNFPNNPKMHNKLRKLSVTVSLNDYKEYKGGHLKFLLPKQDPTKLTQLTVKEIKRQGSLVVFPSFNFHAVTPVTQGTRYSLVMWFLGDPYK